MKSGSSQIAEGVLNSFGITSAVERRNGSSATSVRCRRLPRPEKRLLRTGVMFRPEPPADLTAWEAIMSGNGASSDLATTWLKFAGIKIFYDGGMTLKTALMRDVYPDSHDNYHGIAQRDARAAEATRLDLQPLRLACRRARRRRPRYRPGARRARGSRQGKVDPGSSFRPHPRQL